MNVNLKITTYSSKSNSANPIKTGQKMIKDLVASKELSFILAKRDISAQYRQSYLGYLWVFIIPLINTITWIFLKSSGLIQVQDTNMPYTVYVFSGTMLWQIFVDSLQAPIQQVTASKSILSKLNFPREAILLSGFYKSIFSAVIKLILLIPIAIFFGAKPNFTLLFLPLAMLSILLVGFTIGLLLSPIGTLYGDVGRVIPYIGQFLMFFTPVVFAMPKTGYSALLFKYNFMTPLLMVARDTLSAGTFEWLFPFLLVNTIAIIVLIIAWVIFRVTMPILIERMN